MRGKGLGFMISGLACMMSCNVYAACTDSDIPATERAIVSLDSINAVGTFTITNEGRNFILTSTVGSPFTIKYPRVDVGPNRCWDITEDHTGTGGSGIGGSETKRYWIAVCSGGVKCTDGNLQVSVAPRLKRAISGRSTDEVIMFQGCFYKSNIKC